MSKVIRLYSKSDLVILCLKYLEELGIDGKDPTKEKPPHPRTIFRLDHLKFKSFRLFSKFCIFLQNYNNHLNILKNS